MNVKLLSDWADMLTGDMLLWLSHTDVCSALRRSYEGMNQSSVCGGCGAVMIVRLCGEQ